ncbi:hypothetical protein [Flavicella sediminum]|uniref:hypothetical protein n=1 Tax=Flavicella sediminum TaxID=2585141 RepID=UPI00111DB750|nr:hypothetical protein [Flavicella sediminum]
MDIKNYSIESGKTVTQNGGFLSSVQSFIAEKGEGLNLFQKVMLSLYVLMTFFFFLSAIYFVLTKGFKY